MLAATFAKTATTTRGAIRPSIRSKRIRSLNPVDEKLLPDRRVPGGDGVVEIESVRRLDAILKALVEEEDVAGGKEHAPLVSFSSQPA